MLLVLLHPTVDACTRPIGSYTERHLQNGVCAHAKGGEERRDTERGQNLRRTCSGVVRQRCPHVG